MKKIILCTIAHALFYSFTFSQELILPRDESGRISYQQVVETPGLGQTTLFHNAKVFLEQVQVVKQKKKESFLVEDENKVSSKGGFLVYNFKSPDGEIRYDISIEVKDNKYRYTITDFEFYPYARNRYGKFEREKWRSRSLEEATIKGEQKTWDNHKKKTADKMESLIHQMDLAMQRLPAVAEDPAEKRSGSNW